MAAKKLTPHDERRVAVFAQVDPRAVRRRLAAIASGKGPRQSLAVSSRIDEALRSLGFMASEPGAIELISQYPTAS